MPLLKRLLVAVAQVVAQPVCVAADAYAATDHGCFLPQITLKEVGLPHLHVAVHEEQRVIPRFVGQTIADGRPSPVVRVDDVANPFQPCQRMVLFDGCPVGRAVLHDDDLKGRAGGHGLRVQLPHQSVAWAVEHGNQYGESFFVHRYKFRHNFPNRSPRTRETRSFGLVCVKEVLKCSFSR